MAIVNKGISNPGNPTITPLDAAGTLYALRDGDGIVVGTGTREVCEVLLSILRSCAAPQNAAVYNPGAPNRRPNLRAAITI